MKLVSILAVCSVFLYAEAHVVYSDWEIVADDVVCPRPTTGDCAKAGSCCGQQVGTQRMTRTCLEDHCDDAMLSKTRPCRLRCSEVDANAYGSWERAGNCERPESGACSAENTCCGQLKGTMKHTRSCRAAGGCATVSSSGSTLERNFKCNVRCGHVNPCNLWPNPCQNGATCVIDGHSHSCTCASGYTGHHCETDINECESGDSDCDPNAECSNNVGSYTCTCNNGYQGNGLSCTDINECASNPCQNGGTCNDLVGGYTCSCPDTHSGDVCQTAVGCSTWQIRSGQTGVEKIECDTTPANSEESYCTFTCASGFELKDKTINKINCYDGDWWMRENKYGEEDNMCQEEKAKTCERPTLVHGKGDCNATVEEDGNCEFTCDPGYELNSPGDTSQYFCGPDGSWLQDNPGESPILPTCKESGQVTDDWINVVDLDGPGSDPVNDYVKFYGVKKEDCPQKCIDVGDHFTNVAAWFASHKWYGNNACLCSADIAYPSEKNLNNPDSAKGPFVKLLPGKEWWTMSSCIDSENDPFGHHYYGEKDVTRSGKPCISWDIDDHYYFFYYDDNGIIRDDSIFYRAQHFTNQEHSYCRNPTNDPEGPYCFTDDTVNDKDRGTKVFKDHIEYCDVPTC